MTISRFESVPFSRDSRNLYLHGKVGLLLLINYSLLLLLLIELGNSYVLCKAALEDVGICDKRHITLTQLVITDW